MMVHLYDYAVPVANAASGVPNLREALAGVDDEDRKALLGGLFKVERMPGTMERLSTLVTDLEASFGDLLYPARQLWQAAALRGHRRGEGRAGPIPARVGDRRHA